MQKQSIISIIKSKKKQKQATDDSERALQLQLQPLCVSILID